MEMMCYVVVYKGDMIAYQGLQIDDGAAAYQYAKEKGYRIRLWEMYGLEHVWQLSQETRTEIKEFTKGLR